MRALSALGLLFAACQLWPRVAHAEHKWQILIDLRRRWDDGDPTLLLKHLNLMTRNGTLTDEWEAIRQELASLSPVKLSKAFREQHPFDSLESPPWRDAMARVDRFTHTETPLHCAAYQDHTSAVAALLLAWGADVDTSNVKSKETPLHFAARANNVNVVNLLIDRGANISQEATAPARAEPPEEAAAAEDDIPDDLRCPLTLELFEDPVTAQDGHTYERRAIVEWLSKKKTSPLTHEPLDATALVPQHVVRKLIESFREKRRQR